MKITQQYIADILQISRVTVTKALQHHPDISKGTIKKVEKLAEELGYIPNSIGRSLVTKRTHNIGVIVPKINHSFFSSVIELIYTEASLNGYQIILMVSFESAEMEYNAVKTLMSMNVDGILIDSANTTISDAAYSLILKNNVPFLFFDRKLRNFSADGVFFDDFKLSHELTVSLIEKGFTKFMYITGPRQININHERLKGFQSAMKDGGLEVRKDWVLTADIQGSTGCKNFHRYIKNNDELPQVVLCSSDSIALAVYDVCHMEGIQIPKDMGVVGFGNTLLSSLVKPTLSTVDLDVKSACISAVKRLIGLIENEDHGSGDIIISGKIILRDSISSS